MERDKFFFRGSDGFHLPIVLFWLQSWQGKIPLSLLNKILAKQVSSPTPSFILDISCTQVQLQIKKKGFPWESNNPGGYTQHAGRHGG